MREINCYIPIKVRIVGELSEAHIEQLGQTMNRTLAARLEQARRTLAEHGYASAQATIVTWPGERVDEARLYHGGYSWPSYDNGGKTVSVPVVSGIPSSGKQSDPLEEDWQNELDEAARLANEGASPSEKAFGKRLWLLLIELRPVVFTDEDQLIKLFERSHQTAPSESETLKLAAGRLTIEQLLDIDGDAFPNTWADKVYQDFHSDVDLDALEKTYQLRKKSALSTGIAAELWARGLPLSLHQARNLKVDDV